MDRGAGGLILAGALLGALLLVVAEFTVLYKVHIANSSSPIKTVSGGANHSYAMLVIGLAAAGFGIGAWRSGSRSALLALGVLGLVALLIALLGDLPDSQATGLAGSATRGYVNASSTPSAGLYLETLGGILLIASSGLGFMMPEAPAPGHGPGPDDGKWQGDGPGDGRGGNGRAGNGRDPDAAQPWSQRQPSSQRKSWSQRKRSGS